jgi:hypothetical protein
MKLFDTGGRAQVGQRNLTEPTLAAVAAIFGTGAGGQATLALSSGETWTVGSKIARIPRGEPHIIWKPGAGAKNTVLNMPQAPVRSLLKTTPVPRAIGLSVGFAATVGTIVITELAVRALDSADTPQKRMTLLQDMALAKETVSLIGPQTLPQPQPLKRRLPVMPRTKTKKQGGKGPVRIHGWSKR